MNRRIKLLLSLLALMLCQDGFAAPAWIEQASRPGPNIASVGQSRFDELFLHEADKYRIPYPFERLIEALESRLDNGDHPAVRQVFVPIGRSLQRDTPAPDYFHFPRMVIALEGEPVTTDEQAGQVMEYRLFIAHQPKTETLEVISYNDAAGRFEFQVVENYSADESPRVRPANRVMCMSCHHNAAPIFAVTPWRETSFNVKVANKLVAALPGQFSSLIGVVTLDAGVIDVLAERANYLSAVQAIWKQGCDTFTCRGAMLRAALQYRLSGESSFDSTAASYLRDYVAELTHNWVQKWPRGLALPGSRLSDRNPFVTDAPTIEDDPLMPRPPQATWSQVDSILADGIIYRLAGFFTQADIQRIDRHLIESARSGSLATYRYRATCSATPRDANSYILNCGDNATPASLQASFEIEVLQDKIVSLRFSSLKIPHDSKLLQPDIIELAQFPGRLEARLGNQQDQLSLRLGSGDRIDSMTIHWDDSPTDRSKLEIAVSAEFEIIDQALVKLLVNHQSGHANSLRQAAFRRGPVLRELMQELSMDSLQWLEIDHNIPPADDIVRTRLEGGLALLEPYCGHCHGGETSHPPGFLSGGTPHNLVLQCAARILRRLQAWQENSQFPRSPMPPPASIEFSGVSAADWPTSDHYRTLVSSLENLVSDQLGTRQLSDWRQKDYASLPACLAGTSEL